MSNTIIIGTRSAAPKGAATAASLIDRHVQANFYRPPTSAIKLLGRRLSRESPYFTGLSSQKLSLFASVYGIIMRLKQQRIFQP
jgi:hypothetical protein